MGRRIYWQKSSVEETFPWECWFYFFFLSTHLPKELVGQEKLSALRREENFGSCLKKPTSSLVPLELCQIWDQLVNFKLVIQWKRKKWVSSHIVRTESGFNKKMHPLLNREPDRTTKLILRRNSRRTSWLSKKKNFTIISAEWETNTFDKRNFIHTYGITCYF